MATVQHQQNFIRFKFHQTDGTLVVEDRRFIVGVHFDDVVVTYVVFERHVDSGEMYQRPTIGPDTITIVRRNVIHIIRRSSDVIRIIRRPSNVLEFGGSVLSDINHCVVI